MASATYLAATRTRTPAFFAAVALILGVETAALHLWLRAHHPIIAWTATALSLLTLLWLAQTYRGQDRAGLQLGSRVWRIQVPGRFCCDVPLAALSRVSRPDWRQVPAPDANWLNGAAPLDPNVLLEFATPLPAQLPLRFRRRVRAIGLHLHEPDRALEAWQAVAPQASTRAT